MKAIWGHIGLVAMAQGLVLIRLDEKGPEAWVYEFILEYAPDLLQDK